VPKTDAIEIILRFTEYHATIGTIRVAKLIANHDNALLFALV
jgi:hypothetical protein